MIQDVEFLENKHIKVNHKNSLKRLENILSEEYIDKSNEVVSKHRKIRNYFIKLVTPDMCEQCIKEHGDTEKVGDLMGFTGFKDRRNTLIA